MNKPELIQKIKASEGFSADEKAELISLLNNTKKYGLVWEDKPEAVEEQLRTQLPVLVEVPERRILADDLPQPTQSAQLTNQPLAETPDLFSGTETNKVPIANGQKPKADNQPPNHILIEGDNLHALTALSFTHKGMIDVIYIDPPYNTGNKDFKYNDRFVDKEDSYRHSKWLSFMHKRLEIAKKLLSEKGVIFISIDDNEQAQLKLMCDEVFLENNFIGNFIWVKKKKGSHLSKTLRSMTEYVLSYSKDSSQIELYGENAYIDKWQPLAKRTNSIKILNFQKEAVLTTLDDGHYKAKRYGVGTSSLNFLNDFIVLNGLIISSITVEGPFVWSQKKLNEELAFGSKISLSTKFGFNTLRHNQSEKIKRPSSLINTENGVGTNEDAYQELINIFDKEGVMTYPKPSSLIKYLINTSTFFKSKNSVSILDFFAGTGTTLHATMQLNAEDGGNRQCILVTNNENNISEEVCYERNKRVIQGYTNSKGVWVDGLTNNNLRYYKCDFVESAKTQLNRRKLTRLSTNLLQIKEDCYTDITATNGFDPEICHISTNGQGKYMIVVYHSRQWDETVAALRQWIKTLPLTDVPIALYAFADEQEVVLDDFYDVAHRIKAVPLPDAIYNAYRATFRSLKLEKKQPAAVVTEETAEEEETTE